MVRQRSQEKRESLSWAETISKDPDARPLTREQERELWPLAKAGDEQAKLKLLKSQWRLVYKIAKRYEWTGLPLDDLIGWGMIGLLAAFEKFNHETGNKFSTVSMQWIRNAIGYDAPRNSLACKIPIRFFNKSFRQTEGISDESFQRTKYQFCRHNNLTYTMTESGDEHDVISMKSGAECDTDRIIDEHQIALIVRRSIDALTEPCKTIIRRRMSGETLEDICVDYGVVRERIRQIESQGKKRMREWIEKNHPNLEF